MKKCRQNEPIDPFLRWAGGKRWLAKLLSQKISEICEGRYIEPFLGGGSMFFSVNPMRALLGDLNKDLINAYHQVSVKPNELIAELKKLDSDKDTYYEQRQRSPRTDFQRAVRFLYLNRCCYGGIYRENLKGEFNVPYGGGSRTHHPLWEKQLIVRASEALSRRSVIIRDSDFKDLLRTADAGDVVFCDPTYRTSSRTQFDRYGAVVFNWNDQIELAKHAREACQRGATVIVSNAYCDDVKDLYPSADKYLLHKSKSLGNATKDKNRHVEYLFILDPMNRSNIWESLEEYSLSFNDYRLALS